MANDVRMFHVSGLSIAMGSAEDVKREANRVTDCCDDEGFAKAVERVIWATIARPRDAKRPLDAGPVPCSEFRRRF
jgi:hypothetical protein